MKDFLEMMEIDVTPFCETRKAKDDQGRMVDIAYLPWSQCKLLLHKEGAKVVDFVPLENAEGSYVFEHKAVQDKNGANIGCYYVKVGVTIDDMSFEYSYPLMNGANVVRADTLNQLRISNAHARAFVKGVAVKTGLGYKLWLKEDETTSHGDDIGIHDVMKVKQRIEEKLSVAIRKHGGEDELLRYLGIKRGQLEIILKSFNNIAWLESKL